MKGMYTVAKVMWQKIEISGPTREKEQSKYLLFSNHVMEYGMLGLETKYHSLRGLNLRSLLSHCSGGYKSKIKWPRTLISF